VLPHEQQSRCLPAFKDDRTGVRRRVFREQAAGIVRGQGDVVARDNWLLAPCVEFLMKFFVFGSLVGQFLLQTLDCLLALFCSPSDGNGILTRWR
jgi:hypothetical protein